MINDEVVLFLPSSRQIVATNGQKVLTPKNSLIFWPQENSIFEFIVTENNTPNSEGTSLLPHYLEDKNLSQ